MKNIKLWLFLPTAGSLPGVTLSGGLPPAARCAGAKRKWFWSNCEDSFYPTNRSTQGNTTLPWIHIYRYCSSYLYDLIKCILNRSRSSYPGWWRFLLFLYRVMMISVISMKYHITCDDCYYCCFWSWLWRLLIIKKTSAELQQISNPESEND